jgi:HTH-type transcriptional regulator / antitoxin HigA
MRNLTKLEEISYGQLLRRALPHVIRTEGECARLTNELMRLDERDHLTLEEKELAELLTVLIDDYEERRYPIAKANPQQVLKHLMEARNLTQRTYGKSLGQKELRRKSSTASVLLARLKPRSWRNFFT